MGWYPAAEGAAFAIDAVNPDITTMPLNDVLDEAESQAVALDMVAVVPIHTVERLEQIG